jgi:oligopeptide transport system substrate-binding protein
VSGIAFRSWLPGMASEGDFMNRIRHRHPRACGAVVGLLVFLLLGIGAPAAPGADGTMTGTLRVPLGGDAPSLDPQVAADFSSAAFAFLAHARLVTFDSKGRIVPMAARSWTVSPSGLVYTFHLRDDVYFHGGRRVAAADWKWSFERMAAPETRSGLASLVVGGIVGYDEVAAGQTTQLAGIRAVDPLTLQIALIPSRRGGFLNRVSIYGAAVLAREVVESGGQGWYATQDAGAGPFILKAWERNARIVLDANPRYFEGAPRLATVELVIVPSATTRLNMYQSGQLDFVDVPLADLQRIQADPGFKNELRLFPRGQVIFLGLNPRVYLPFQDVRIRRAVAMSIDRARIVKAVFFGFYIPANGIVPTVIPGADANMRGVAYDPAGAKKLLAESGQSGKLPPLTIAINPVAPDYEMAAVPVAEMLKSNLGIDVRLQRQEFTTFTAAMNKRTLLEAFMTGWAAAYMDFSYYLDLLLYSKSGLDRTNYASPEFDRLIDDANSTGDPQQREALYRKAEAVAVSDATMVPIAFTQFALLIKPSVSGLETSPLSLGWLPFTKVSVRR